MSSSCSEESFLWRGWEVFGVVSNALFLLRSSLLFCQSFTFSDCMKEVAALQNIQWARNFFPIAHRLSAQRGPLQSAVVGDL